VIFIKEFAMSPAEELEAIYVSVGSGTEFTDALYTRINELEAIIDPVPARSTEPQVIEGVCGNDYCNGHYCWECAAIRGGDPMDV
jgi:hypothetical protein